MTRLLLCIPAVILSLLLSASTTTALVSVPHRQPVQTLTRSLNNAQLYLETSPLSGGPSFLPLHVTVVLAIADGKAAVEEHRYDLIPQRPTDPQTLRTLLTLGTVPAIVRSRRVSRSATETEDQQIPMGVLPDFGLVLMDQEDENEDITSTLVAQNTTDSSSQLLTTATMFCARYPAELHLLRANCWTFAWELYDVLEQEQARQKATQAANKGSAGSVE